MAGAAIIPRSRGSVCGVLLILLGAWGGLIPFTGPYFRYGFTPDKAWAYTNGRLVLSAAPGAAVLLAGLIIALTRSRVLGGLAGFLAALAGAWFIAGLAIVSILPGVFRPGSVSPGVPIRTGTTIAVLTDLSFFAGIGALIVFFAALAIGRFSLLAAKDVSDAAAISGTGPGYGSGYSSGQFPSVQLQYPASEQGSGAEQGYPAGEQEQYQPGRDQVTATHDYQQQAGYQHAPDLPSTVNYGAQQQYQAPQLAAHHDFPGDENPITHEQFRSAPQQSSPGPPFPLAPDPLASTDQTRPADQQDFPPAHGPSRSP